MVYFRVWMELYFETKILLDKLNISFVNLTILLIISNFLIIIEEMKYFIFQTKLFSVPNLRVRTAAATTTVHRRRRGSRHSQTKKAPYSVSCGNIIL